MQRRTFLTKTALTATGLLTSAPYIRAVSKTSFDGTIIGHGEHRYRVDTLWSKADAEKTPVKDCHEMVQAADGHLI
ncbi:MAG: 6-bladed beta-propeller, partial [Verrucomicrobia bacterium]|nr:6-bladed beta-propeller [Verrucomicrobiota bacterium]